MRWQDSLHLALRALTAHRLRSFLTLLGIGVGIAAVILLTSIGEGLHRFVLAEFGQFGTNVINLHPGRQGARGGPPGLPSTARDLTLDDAAALARLPNVRNVSGSVSGNAEVRAQGRVRRSTVLGVGPQMQEVYSMRVGVGQFLPPDEAASARAFVVLGPKLARELFGSANALGERVEIGAERFRVVGIMEEKGQFLGIDLDDAAYIPVVRGMALYQRDGLMEIALTYDPEAPAARVAEAVKKLMIARHGREDFSVLTQEDMLATLSNILDLLTAAVGALGAISLLVGGVGIVTIMSIAVTERTGEIGLLVALGARRRTILALFLGEAVVLAGIGGLLGLLAGAGLAQLVGLLVPAMPVATPWQYALAAEVVAVVVGLAAGVLPARRAARLDAVEALRASLELPGVRDEVESLRRILPGTALLDEQFTVGQFHDESSRGEYRIVHIASHGVFGGSAEASFIMAYDDVLSMNSLEALLRSDRLRARPIELLGLSACQTAEGNDRAPLGFAGAAIKARARAVLGTLWPVEDNAAKTVMQRFYAAVAAGSSKGDALREAQLALLAKPETAHPFFWAPFVLIGNWQ